MIVKLVYSKKEMMKFLGHLDLIRFFERAFRRLKLPLAFSKGFNPHPKMNFGGPLSVGVASDYEVMEVTLEHEVDIEQFIAEFNKISPDGIKLLDYRITDKTEPLMSALALSTYVVKLPEKHDLLERYRESEKIILLKRNKRRRMVEKDLKTYIHQFEIDENDTSGLTYKLAIMSNEKGSAKPLDIVSILLSDCEDFVKDDVDILRTGMFYLDESGEYKPLLQL